MEKAHLVTGIDRSYKRSIYQVIDENEKYFLLKFVSISGFTLTAEAYEQENHCLFRIVSWRPKEEFRLASTEEVSESATKIERNNR
jgi:hypothetical protein